MKHILHFLIALLTLPACNMDSPAPESAEEIGEEAAELVEAIGPDSEEAGELAPEIAVTTPEETLTLVESAGGLTALPIGSATAIIDNWIETLHTNPAVDDSDDLARGLTRLKALLQQTPIDGEAVGELLGKLAAETEEAAEDSDDEAVGALAELLEEAGEALD